jgi:heme-degrading monooxygenase HmoA
MHLRLSRFVGLAPERADEMVEAFEESDYLDRLAESPGFDGYLLAADRGRGKITAMSFWRTADDLAASDQVAEAARAMRIAAARPERRPILDRYEVVFHRGMGRFEGHLRLSRLADLSENALDAVLGSFEDGAYVDQLEAVGGFGGYLVAADRENGKVTAMSLWRTANDLRASDQLAAEARENRVAATGDSHDPIVDRYEVMLER